MPFKNEQDFEFHIRDIIKNKILQKSTSLKLFKNKRAVDILICKNGKKPEIFFLEIKYHKVNHGRLGFGSAKGVGFQPEIVATQPDYFKKNMKWILGHELRPDEYWLVNNQTLARYISGGVVASKYNNIQKKIFNDEKSLSKTELISNLWEWLSHD